MSVWSIGLGCSVLGGRFLGPAGVAIGWLMLSSPMMLLSPVGVEVQRRARRGRTWRHRFRRDWDGSRFSDVSGGTCKNCPGVASANLQTFSSVSFKPLSDYQAVAPKGVPLKSHENWDSRPLIRRPPIVRLER